MCAWQIKFVIGKGEKDFTSTTLYAIPSDQLISAKLLAAPVNWSDQKKIFQNKQETKMKTKYTISFCFPPSPASFWFGT